MATEAEKKKKGSHSDGDNDMRVGDTPAAGEVDPSLALRTLLLPQLSSPVLESIALQDTPPIVINKKGGASSPLDKCSFSRSKQGSGGKGHVNLLTKILLGIHHQA